MRAVLDIVLLLLNLYWWVLIVMIVMSWLFAFNVINAHNQFVAAIWRAVSALTEPLLRPIRRVIPSVGGLDLSPLVLFIAIIFIQQVIAYYVYPYVF